MKHARKDYDRIQDPHNLIPWDEPVFLLRAKDAAAPAAVEAWADAAENAGADDKIVMAAYAQAEVMREYAKKNYSGGKVPDAPEGTLP
jgi:hypothetical protein